MNMASLMRDISGAKPSEFRPFRISERLALIFAANPLPHELHKPTPSLLRQAGRDHIAHFLDLHRRRQAQDTPLVEHGTRQRVDNARIIPDLRKAA